MHRSLVYELTSGVVGEARSAEPVRLGFESQTVAVVVGSSATGRLAPSHLVKISFSIQEPEKWLKMVKKTL